MPLIQKLDLDGVTFGALYRFADLARSAGLGENDPVTVETRDERGNELGRTRSLRTWAPSTI